MTNETIIKQLKRLIPSLQYADDVNAVKGAIQALSQEPKYWMDNDGKVHKLVPMVQEPCDDAISRDAVNTLVDELARAISDERCHIPQRGRDTGHIMHDILDLPSVTQKSGKWIIRDDLSTVRYYQCSECNEIDLDISDYCPNCGARMESEVSNG